MARRVELEFRRAARRLVPDGSALLAAVSGGADSMALLHLLARYAPGRGIALTVAHLDHALRRGSAADRRFVERAAARLGLACVSERRDVASLRHPRESPEEAARRVRRAFLNEAGARVGADRIATGHTLDDQAETVLMRLARGAGATALTGMAEAGPGPFVRPLLSIERDPLRRWLESAGESFREDPSNRDLRFDRNRVRRVVLPALVDSLNPRTARNLVRAARRFREDAVYLDALAEARLEAIARDETNGAVALDALALAEEAPPVANRVAALALRRAGADARRITSRHVEALVDLAHGGSGREAHLVSGLTARRARRWIRIGK